MMVALITGEASIKEDLLREFKKRFEATTIWDKTHLEIISFCAKVPETIDNDNAKVFADSLLEMKRYLVNEGVQIVDLTFIDNYISRLQNTHMIATHKEEESAIDNNVVNQYATLTYKKDGIVAINEVFNFKQLCSLSTGVFWKNKELRFFISPNLQIQGQVLADLYNAPVTIEVATVIKETDPNTPEDTPIPIFFGEKYDKRKYTRTRGLEADFHVYKFQATNTKEYILLSVKPIELGEYIISGVMTKITDPKNVTQNSRLATSLPYIFVHSAISAISKFDSKEQFFERMKIVAPEKKLLFDFPFTQREYRNDGSTRQMLLAYPKEFKKLMWAWLIHKKKGMFGREYPLHLMVIGPRGVGKSQVLNNLQEKINESDAIFSGGTSTLKSLVPTFVERPPSVGYLCKRSRFALLDEFFNRANPAAKKMKSTIDSGDEALSFMNDLLEHQERTAMSGNGSLRVNMRARCIAVSNPPFGVSNTTELINNMPLPFMSRWLIYWMSEDSLQSQIVRKNPYNCFLELPFDMTNNDFLSIIDFMQSFDAEYDLNRIISLMKIHNEVLNDTLKVHYDARHNHHAVCLMDGLIKLRCLLEEDTSFVATEEDYSTFDEIWGYVLHTWVDSTNMKHIPVERRKFYLPDYVKYVFNYICEQKRPMEPRELMNGLSSALSKELINAAYHILSSNELIKEREYDVVPYYFGETLDNT